MSHEQVGSWTIEQVRIRSWAGKGNTCLLEPLVVEGLNSKEDKWQGGSGWQRDGAGNWGYRDLSMFPTESPKKKQEMFMS